MKRLKIVIASIIFLTACGNVNSAYGTENNNAYDEEEYSEGVLDSEVAQVDVQETLYSVGDTVDNGYAEFTLVSSEIQDEYNGIKLEDEQVFVVVDYYIKNIGKTELGWVYPINGGSSLLFQDVVCVDYDDGFVFGFDEPRNIKGVIVGAEFLTKNDKNDSWYTLDELKPLSEGVSVEVAIPVPHEVETNTDKAIILKALLPKGEGSEEITNDIFAFKVR